MDLNVFIFFIWILKHVNTDSMQKITEVRELPVIWGTNSKNIDKYFLVISLS